MFHGEGGRVGVGLKDLTGLGAAMSTQVRTGTERQRCTCRSQVTGPENRELAHRAGWVEVS